MDGRLLIFSTASSRVRPAFSELSLDVISVFPFLYFKRNTRYNIVRTFLTNVGSL